MKLTKSTLLKFYKKKEIQEEMIKSARNKEVGICYNKGFGKRPDILSYPRDILELALRDATSFHISEESWSNPLAIGNITKKEAEELLIGWDLIMDIDCKFLEYSQICADVVIKFLTYCGVKDISVKFSGNKGFHIGVPFEAFPKRIGEQSTKDLFPAAPRKIAFYVKENIKEELGKRILAHEKGQFGAVREKVDLPQEKITRYDYNEFGDKVAKLSVDKFLEIDTILISHRHLYRMPYSLHEKSGLVSLPLDPDKIMEFDKETALPERILAPIFPFLEREIEGESARRLLLQALDFKIKVEEEPKLKTHQEIEINSPIKEELFPPCIKRILKGLEDGRKRSLFCLMNFLGKIGWSKEEIEIYLYKWNKENNKGPLREMYIKGQLNHFNPGDKLPPNCSNEAYYLGIDVCRPDSFCPRIKNPANYTILKWKKQLQEKEK